ncbi:MAG: 30S ribosome-binding factor RbfA [Thermoanaerobaculia bacterium]
MSQRTERVADQIRSEMSILLQREVRDPRVQLASVSRVEVSRDLGHARIWISVLGDEEQRLAAMEDRARARLPPRTARPPSQAPRHPGAPLRARPRRRAPARDHRPAREAAPGRRRIMTIESVLAPLAEAKRILLTSHQSPDGDAIGTELGLARILRGAGREVAIWNDHPVPPAYRRMPGADQIHSGPTPPPGFPAAFDLAVVLECPTLDRSGLEKELVQIPLLNIDHHLGNPGYGVASGSIPKRRRSPS